MNTLDELIDQAEREGKWLFCYYQQLWFAPQELRAANANGQFRWGPQNFDLRDPSERLAQLDVRLERTRGERELMTQRIQASQVK